MFDCFKAPFQAVMIPRLVMHDGAKQPREVLIKVGVPYEADDGEWRTPVSAPWHVSHPVHIAGIDAIHSMQLRFRVYRTRAGERRKAAVLL